MKLSSALVIASMASASATKSISGKNVAKVLRAARKLEDGNAQEDENAYLAKYTLKMVSCEAGVQVYSADGNGEYENNAVIFRLCPSENGCDSDSQKGCSSGYGDYVVGLSTFIDAWFEDQRDNMQWDDNFAVDQYAECAQYEIDNDENNQWENYAFYIGPTCTSDGKDVALDLFTDEACTYKSEDISFSDISNGWTLPYSDGGIVSTQCIDCYGMNENGEYEIREMCGQLQEQKSLACEEKMEYYSYYGQNVQGCEQITEMMPKSSKSSSGSGGKVFGWIVFLAVVVGLAGYIVWWRKKKAGSSDGLNA
jgi:hypothetical protein